MQRGGDIHLSPVPRSPSMVLESGRAMSRIRAQALAGVLVAAAGVVILLGIITAEALYPDVYSTFDNEISDLGGTRPPNSVIRQPSAHIFNATMLISGVLILGGAAIEVGVNPQRRMGIWLGLMGAGVFGVGVFPGNAAPYHGLFALLAFVSGGVGAVVASTVTTAPFRWLSLGLGFVALGSLVTAFLGDLTPAMEQLGDGGVERWVAYPTVLWFLAFGGYAMGGGRLAHASPELGSIRH